MSPLSPSIDRFGGETVTPNRACFPLHARSVTVVTVVTVDLPKPLKGLELFISGNQFTLSTTPDQISMVTTVTMVTEAENMLDSVSPLASPFDFNGDICIRVARRSIVCTMSCQMDHDQSIGVRLDTATCDRLDALRSTLSARASGIRVTRSDALRTALTRGLTALEAELAPEQNPR